MCVLAFEMSKNILALCVPETVTSVQASCAKEETLGGGIVVVAGETGEATTSQSKPVLTTGSRLLLKRTWISELYEKLGGVE